MEDDNTRLTAENKSLKSESPSTAAWVVLGLGILSSAYLYYK